MSETRKVVQHHFSQSAENYTRSPIHASGADLEWMLNLHSLTGEERVLDVGTGIGYAAFAFAPHVKSVDGIDITPAMLEQAEIAAAERGIENVSFSTGDAEAIPRDNATYDIVLSRWCAHHYGNIRKSVAEIARVLKPGGVFILADSIAPSNARVDTFVNTLETLRDTGHVRNYTIREWLEFMETVGLYGEVKHEWSLRLDGDDWVARIKTPAVYVDAIRALLDEADSDLRAALRITGDDDTAGWGFDLPTVMIKGTKL